MDWAIPLGTSLELGLNSLVSYTDDYFTSTSSREGFDPVTNPTGNLIQDSFVTIDAAVSVGDPDGKWTLSLIGNNLTDEIFANTSAPAPFGAGSDDQLVTLNRGRQVFVELGFKF